MKSRPIGAELKLHRNARDDAKYEGHAEDAGQEASRLVKRGAWSSQSQKLADNDERCQPHRELRKQVVKGRGESEVQAMNGECCVHGGVIHDLSRCAWRQAKRDETKRHAKGIETRSAHTRERRDQIALVGDYA